MWCDSQTRARVCCGLLICNLFVQNTLAQRPRYYLTVDLRPELGDTLRLNEDEASAHYRGQSLEIIVPIIGTAGELFVVSW